MAWNPFKKDREKHVGSGGEIPWGTDTIVDMNNTDTGISRFTLGTGNAVKKYIHVKKEGTTVTFGLQHMTLENDIHKAIADPLLKQYGMADSTYTLGAKDKSGLDIHLSNSKVWQSIAVYRMVVMSQLLSLYKTSKDLDGPQIIDIGTSIKELNPKEQEKVEKVINGLFVENASNLDLVIDSEVFKWSEKTFNLAMDMDVPEHDITADIMPVESMFIVFEKPVYYSDPVDTASDRRFASWINLKILRDEITSQPYRIQWSIESRNLSNYRQLVREGLDHAHHEHSTEGQCEAHGDDTIAHGWIGISGKYPKDIHDPEEFEGDPKSMETVRFVNDMIIKLLTFVNTTVSRVESESVDRATRKRAKKEGHSYPNVNVVNLRAYENNGSSSPNGSSEDSYMRGHKVRGFYRAQHHGINNSLTKTIYIDPFYRGDLENMIEEKVYSVSR